MATEVMVSSNSCSFSTLDPNAPIYVPAAYRVVEDFSEQWWSLVDSSPWFRDYWLTECFSDPQTNDSDLPEIDDLFDADFEAAKENDEKEDINKELISLGVLKWRKHQPAVERPRYGQKAPKIVNVKVSPRPIQQPR